MQEVDFLFIFDLFAEELMGRMNFVVSPFPLATSRADLSLIDTCPAGESVKAEYCVKYENRPMRRAAKMARRKKLPESNADFAFIDWG